MISGPDWLIRDAVLSDMAAISAVYAQAVRETTASFEYAPPDVVEMSRRFTALFERGYPYLVAERDGEVLGYAYAGPFRAREAYRFTVENSVYVAPQALRRGVGLALLEALIARCEQHGFRRMVAVITGPGSEASVALHQRAGFTPVGEIPGAGYKFERWCDILLMQRSLGAGAESPP